MLKILAVPGSGQRFPLAHILFLCGFSSLEPHFASPNSNMHRELGLVLKCTHSFMTLFAHAFVGYFLVTLRGDTLPPGTRDLVLLRLVVPQMVVAVVVALAVLGGFKTKTTSWAHFRRPSSSSSFTTEANKQKPAWSCGVMLYTSHTTTTHSYGCCWLHRGSS